MENMSEKSLPVKPLASVNAVWEHDWSEYPDLIRVPMEDGKVVTYRIDTKQPHPQFLSAMDLLKKLPVYGGYQYREPEKKKRRGL